MDAHRHSTAMNSEPESKKSRKDSSSERKDQNIPLDSPQTCSRVHEIGKVCFTDHCNAFGECTMMLPKVNTEKTKTKKIVYIWDMDETLILLKSLLNGKYAEPFNGSKDVQHGIKIGRQWEKHILQVCDEFFFYEQIENFNEPHLDTWNSFDDGIDLLNYDFCGDNIAQPCDDANRRKLAYRYRYIRNKYAQGLDKILTDAQIQIWQDLYDVTDAYTDGWLSAGRAFLEECLLLGSISGQGATPADGTQGLISATEDIGALQNVNVLVTSGTLIPSLVKCLLFRLNGLFTPDNVYSSWDVGKSQCFQWIKERFNGPDVQFCVVGDSMEECQAAQTLGWPFVKIDPHPDGVHRFPGLSLSTIKHYLDCIYGGSQSDDEER